MSKDNKLIAKALSTMTLAQIECYLNNVDKLEKVLYAPPTADEVCTELDKWYIEATGDLLIASINDFTYDKKEKIFYKRMLNKPHQMTMCRLDTNDCVQLREPLPPHLITMIGKL